MSTTPPPEPIGGVTPIRRAYEEAGVEAFYRSKGHIYTNPHEAAVIAGIRWAFAATGAPDGPLVPAGRILDLACGSGEATLAVRRLHPGVVVTACDPFTAVAFTRRTGLVCEPWSFADVAGGAADHLAPLDAVVCSCALHLCEASRLPGLVGRLALLATHLVVLTPTNRPHLDPAWGFRLVAEHRSGGIRTRVHARTHGGRAPLE